MKKLRELYCSKRANLFLAAVLSVLFLPRGLKAILFVMQKSGLSGAKVMLCNGTGLFCMTVFASLAAGTEGKERWKRIPQVAGISGLWLLFSWLLGGILLNSVFLTDWTYRHAQNANALYYLPTVILLCLRCLCFGFFSMVFVIHAQDAEDKTTLLTRFALAGKCFLQMFLFSVIFGLVYMGYDIAYGILVQNVAKDLAVTGYFVRALLLSLLVFILLAPFYAWMVRAAEKKLAGCEPSEKKKGKIFEAVVPLAAAVVTGILGLFTGRNNARTVLSDVYGFAYSAALSLKAGDLGSAMHDIDQMGIVSAAWKAYLEGNETALNECLQKADGNLQVRLLHAWYNADEKETDKAQTLSVFKNGILTEPAYSEWYFGYLDVAKNVEKAGGELAEKEEAFRKELVLNLIANDMYQDQALKPSALTKGEKKEILEGLREESLAYINEDFAIYEMFLQNVNSNGLTTEMLYSWLELSEQYPENLWIQRVCVYIGAVWLDDFAAPEDMGRIPEIKEKLKQITFRYDALAMEVLKDGEKEYTEERRKKQKRVVYDEVAQLLYKFDTEEAYAYVRKAMEDADSEVMEDILLNIAVQKGDYETALPYLVKNHENNPEDVYTLYVLILTEFRMEDMGSAIEHTCEFANLVSSREGEPDEGEMLSSLADTFVYGDATMNTTTSIDALRKPESNSPYALLSDAEKRKFDAAPYFKTLLETDYQYRYWENGDFGEGLTDENFARYKKLETDMEKLIEEAPWLSAAYTQLAYLYSYTQAVNRLSDQKKYEEVINCEKALEYFQKSLEIDADQEAVWYSLAVTYDYLERYKEAYEAAYQAVERSMDGNYGKWGEANHGYGTPEHARNLMNELKSYLDVQ